MSSSQEDFVEDNVQIVGESLSDMDPALLFAANHFVEDLLVKAQEEASRRQFSETEVTFRPHMSQGQPQLFYILPCTWLYPVRGCWRPADSCTVILPLTKSECSLFKPLFVHSFLLLNRLYIFVAQIGI